MTTDLRGSDADSDLIVADLCNRDEVDRLISDVKPDVIFDFKGIMSGRSQEDPELSFRVNLVATWYLMEAAIKHNVSRYIFPSSLAAIGVHDTRAPFDDAAVLQPFGVYGSHKAAVEAMVTAQVRRGLDMRVLRLGLVISPRVAAGSASSWGSQAFLHKSTEAFQFPVPENFRLPLVYSEDAIEAVILLGLLSTDQIARNRILNAQGLSASPSEIGAAIKRRRSSFTWNSRIRTDAEVTPMIETWPSDLKTDRLHSLGWNPCQNIDQLAELMIREEAYPGNAALHH